MRPFHPSFILTALASILPYIGVTLGTMLGTCFFGGLIGLIVARARIRNRKISNAVAQAYIYIVRCIPSIVLLFIVYYGLPELLLSFGVNINDSSKWFFVITTFSILFSANMAEVFRSSYEAIDPGQREAALAAGMSELQAFRRIVLPQAAVVALPNFCNALVSLMKEGSLSYTIGMIDVMGQGQLMIGINHGSYGLEVYIALALIYWSLTLILEKTFGMLESVLARGKKRNHPETGGKEHGTEHRIYPAGSDGIDEGHTDDTHHHDRDHAPVFADRVLLCHPAAGRRGEREPDYSRLHLLRERNADRSSDPVFLQSSSDHAESRV